MESKQTAGNRPWQEQYFDKFYLSREGWRNGTVEFHELISAHVQSEAKVLELGPGPSNATTQYLREVALTVDGLDVDEEARNNPYLDNVLLYDGTRFPFRDGTYDAVVADYVMEHVDDPRAVINEIARVLKPGGAFVFRVPNRYHYVAWVSSVTPHSIHRKLANPLRNRGSVAHEPYEAFYRFCSRRDIEAITREAGLEERVLSMVEKEPSYCRFSRVAFLGGMLYEKMVNASEALGTMRANIFGVYAKPLP